jgi:hypothetical protein
VKERTLNEPTEDYFMEVKVIPSFKKDWVLKQGLFLFALIMEIYIL